MTNISASIFNDPFPSLYPHFQFCNRRVDRHKPNFPLHEKVIVYILSYRTMKVRLAKPIGSIKKMMRELMKFISLLFGMCSSQSCLILDAFCGASLYRILVINIFSLLTISFIE
ncbi:MAG: hypothetical protein WCG93_15890 [Paludibacter sp.]